MAQLLIAEMSARRAGEVLCGELLRRNLNPTLLKVMDGGGDVMIVMSIIDGGDDADWAKGFLLDRKHLSPDVVERKLEDWKAKVRADLMTGKSSGTVKAAIKRWGRAAVDRAVAPGVAVA